MSLYPFTIDYSKANSEDIRKIEEIIDRISFNGLHSNPIKRVGTFFLYENKLPEDVIFPEGCCIRPGLAEM